MRHHLIGLILLGGLALSPTPASARDDRLELWLNPTFALDLDEQTFAEIETQQRFRSEGGEDQYVGRLWLGRKFGGGVTGMVGIHRGHEGAGRETRLIQQLSYPLVGPFQGRTRLEQRFLNDEPRTAWRIRQRAGVAVPLSNREDGWALSLNTEGFFTLRASEAGGATGLTGLRSFVGVEREFERVELELGYTRQQNIRRNAPDLVGHAPTIALTFKL